MKNTFHKLTNARSAINISENSDVLLEISDELRKNLQKTILDMYKDILSVCKKYNITPYLVFGSALGAVRHNGFIPWDDDLDIGMTREDYSKFIEVFDNELSGMYTINAPNLSIKPKARFTKIFKKGTVCREVYDSEDSLNGIFIDVFIIENIPRNKFIRLIRGTYCNALEFISSQVYLYENDNPAMRDLYMLGGSDNYKFRIGIGRLFSFKSSDKWFNSVDRTAQYKHTGLFGIVTGRKHYFGEKFEGNSLFPCKTIIFEDVEAPVFNNVDEYLSCLYDDYMSIPPKDKRERHYVIELKF